MAETAVFEVKQYMVVLRHLEVTDFEGVPIHVRGLVRCLGDDYTLDVYFLTDDSQYPDPIYKPEEKKGYMFLPFRDIGVLIDLLRNERPIYAHLRGDKPDWTSITTTKEPVGEGESS